MLAKGFIIGFVSATMTGMVLIGLILLFDGCASNPALQTYQDQQMACVSQYATKMQIDACRNAVKMAHCGKGGDLYEAGLCSWDGGAE